ncbi:MAG: hypothetical protein KGK10_11475 [Rhodospirillales bacterium]|nr:hypothetical protein [Rhodospirillales bacterium]
MRPLRDAESSDHSPDGAAPQRRRALLAILVILLLGIAGWWISQRLRQASSIQDCVMQGRHNCAPVGN